MKSTVILTVLCFLIKMTWSSSLTRQSKQMKQMHHPECFSHVIISWNKNDSAKFLTTSQNPSGNKSVLLDDKCTASWENLFLQKHTFNGIRFLSATDGTRQLGVDENGKLIVETENYTTFFHAPERDQNSESTKFVSEPHWNFGRFKGLFYSYPVCASKDTRKGKKHFLVEAGAEEGVPIDNPDCCFDMNKEHCSSHKELKALMSEFRFHFLQLEIALWPRLVDKKIRRNCGYVSKSSEMCIELTIT
eukprot:m.252966 g.252966  ORF g.252966 m.252966 type:complete len:247 (+) comp40359_c0_seq2:614-1354(+)